MARTYKKLNYKDRQRLEEMVKVGEKVTAMAAEMGVHRATLYRELERGGASGRDHTGYSADRAQKALFA